MKKTILLTMMLLSLCGAAETEVFRYIDGNGRIHYVDKLESIPAEYRKQVDNSPPLPKISKVKAPHYATPAPPPVHEPQHLSKTKTVEIFVAAWCPHCRALEKFLKEKGIRYLRHDIENDTRSADLYKKLGGGGIPLVKIGSTLMRGFHPQSIMQALEE